MTDFAVAWRTDTTQTIVERPATIEQLRERVAKLRAEQDPGDPARIVGLMRRPRSPIWELAEP
ncbi:hypothetical protein SEA_GALADRIEL_64 [Gordonia phage Galadriel]|uniref:Uncharacterized protein n=2 Tax=Vividuovirus TaxID=2560251 RepID=A0A7G8LDZ8_9CAUD|nr:hypothetical protein KNU61_gp64 [Gordonia phage Galadriel]YP_010109521.1 hypothetical protein KNV17_gp67 [Gordonia phage Paries]QDH92083.1 hypothetical protein SEA_GALADRIEL_64 [Gordonia phage Galadriel]QNJ55470.1 hypothetical protein SEA_PARIES_67 [Gordonia phage Paries]